MKEEVIIGMPSGFELFILILMIFGLFYIPYNLAKKKNLSIGWNIFWTILFGPFWIVVLLLRKKKDISEDIIN